MFMLYGTKNGNEKIRQVVVVTKNNNNNSR